MRISRKQSSSHCGGEPQRLPWTRSASLASAVAKRFMLSCGAWRSSAASVFGTLHNQSEGIQGQGLPSSQSGVATLASMPSAAPPLPPSSQPEATKAVLHPRKGHHRTPPSLTHQIRCRRVNIFSQRCLRRASLPDLRVPRSAAAARAVRVPRGPR